VQSKGFRTVLTRFDGDPPGSASLLIESSDPSFNDLFAVLCGEVVQNVASRAQSEASLAAFLSCLQHWKRFFDSTGLDGLSDESLMGLLAELHFLKDQVLPHAGNNVGAVSSWVGPDPLSKDFQFSTCSIEVKCSSMREHAKVHISGERQLDVHGFPSLFLFVLQVERVGAGGTTVPALVDELRATIDSGGARAVFEDKLISYGYHDAHRQMYIEKPFVIHRHSLYSVAGTFPRIVAPLPSGVGDLNYTVALAACSPFAVGDAELNALIKQSTSPYDA